MTTDPADLKDLAAAFMAQRHFNEAESAYQRVAEDSRFSAEAQYQLARIQFFRYDYARAAEGYRAVAAAYPGSNWERDAQYQVGNSLWRLRKYDEAEKAYLLYLSNYKTKPPETAVRDLIDIYRAMGQPAKAVALIDRTLTTRPSVATRQVLLFTKAKILYIQEKYSAALQVIRQLKGSRLQNTAGGTSSDELVYFEALCLQKTGDAAAAKAAWLRLARTPDSYYGQLAMERLGTATTKSNADVCANKPDRARDDAVTRLAAQRRPLLTETASTNDTLTELMFLQLWDEASVWIDQGPKRPNAALAADLQYAAGRFNRAITYADRLPASNGAALSMRYPAGYREAICKSAMQNGVDPLWLHAIIWQESKYNPSAQSGAAARGLMQFIPDTAQVLAQPAGIANLTLDMLYNPETSIQLGAYYWATLLQEFKSPQLALAAYNAGPDNVRRWQDKWPGSDGEFFVADIGFTETKRYVQAVSSARMMYGRIN
jgi:soluble lytic murein transglycosylase